MVGWIDGLKDVKTDDGWIDRLMAGWIEGYKDGWKDVKIDG